MVRIKRRDKEEQRRIARERIDILFSLARKIQKDNPERSRKYVKRAWEIAKKYRIRLGKRKYTFCRKCFTLWGPDTLTVRLIHEPYSTVLYKCKVCGAEYRIPYVRERKERRKKVQETNRRP